MQILHGFNENLPPFTGTVLTIGNYDGVHLGHQELLKCLVNEAAFFKVPSVVITFNPHPVKVLYPQRKTERLFDFQDQQEQMEKLGVDFCIIQKFSKEFSQLSAEDFFKDYLIKYLRPKTIVVGHDFSFGSQRTGNLDFLERHCSENGIKLIIIPPFKLRGAPVSSSRIRQALKAGELSEVKACLGRDFYLRGTVEKGFQRGRTIGVPTANITPDIEFVPRLGVYFTLAWIQGVAKPSITNIGMNPTVSDTTNLKIETHIFDFSEQIYDQPIAVSLLKFWRDERKFSGIEELKQQIQLDLIEARNYFAGAKK
ncbi:MAG: bifunctional riboflavin kinase/FAD synthetase [Bdellovibrionia bacterium]